VGVLVSTSEAKTHLRVDSNTEDGYISQIIDAAESYVSEYLNRALSPWTEDSPVAPTPVSVKQAVLLVIGDLYANREGVGDKTYNVNPTVQSLLHFHRTNIGV
jgi:uncharacterized phage protein (predicted DNA packaging)